MRIEIDLRKDWAWVMENQAVYNKARKPNLNHVEKAVTAATKAVLSAQQGDGHFVFELEADVSIPAEYIVFHDHLAEPIVPEVAAKIGNYLRRTQAAHGGWPLFHEGAFNMSSTVKAYFALKLIGDSPDAAHMQRARAAILARGGAAETNVFTRCMLATYGFVPWRAVPVMPVELILLPEWFPFHISKISYWARTVLVPLMVVMSLRARARNPQNVRLHELFVVPPDQVRHWPDTPHKRFPWTIIFRGIDKILRVIDPYFPKALRKHAVDKAVAFVTERLNGKHGIGAIWPAIINSALMYDVLGYPHDHPDFLCAFGAIENLLTVKEAEAYCQPCFSPVWDTALTAHALLEAGGDSVAAPVGKALAWLKPLQILDFVGDCGIKRPRTRPGGWAFQYVNAHYPDLDDTAVVVLAMDRAANAGLTADADYTAAIARGREWIEGMQSSNGGYGAFDADNNVDYLNYIPFADHGALLDPPTADVTARCVSMLAQLGEASQPSTNFARAVDFLRKEQEADGSWYGRWGVNYIYGTWSALCALNGAGVGHESEAFKRAVAWLKAIQNEDGGWGEGGESYALDYKGYETAPSTASQTAWALLGLMAAGQIDDPVVDRGIQYLLGAQRGDGTWHEERFTGTGFPRVFYLRYHGYSKFFPLWAMARFRNLKRTNHHAVVFGM
jgi:squalene-hopene/tetraprenyl-beta-curcumene cyclase